MILDQALNSLNLTDRKKRRYSVLNLRSEVSDPVLTYMFAVLDAKLAESSGTSQLQI